MDRPSISTFWIDSVIIEEIKLLLMLPQKGLRPSEYIKYIDVSSR